MKITGLKVYQVDLPLREESYNWSDGKGVAVFDSTIVEVCTDSGIIGLGEVCPLGPNYLPSYAKGVRTGLQELGPKLIGMDPTEIGKLNTYMDYHLKGHPYVKSPIDMACWDILGKETGYPVCILLGGRYGEAVDLYRTISQRSADEMAANVLKYHEEGYNKFQLKVGGCIEEDIARIRKVRQALPVDSILIADANTGWLSHQAIKIAKHVEDLDVYIEQPCVSYEECLRVRQHTNLPFILDENIHSIENLVRAYTDHAADIVNLKISKLGGLTKAKQARDLCVTFGIAMTLEDTWGSDIVTAAIAHFAHSTPEKFRFSATDFNSYCAVNVAFDGPQKNKFGQFKASEKAGLGVELKREVAGEPVFVL